MHQPIHPCLRLPRTTDCFSYFLSQRHHHHRYYYYYYHHYCNASPTSIASGLPKRIIKETERLVAEPYSPPSLPRSLAPSLPSFLPPSQLTSYSVPGINAVPHEDNLRYFDVSVCSPLPSPFSSLPSPLRSPDALTRPDPRPRAIALRRRHLPSGAVFARRLPHDAAQDSLPDQDIPPQHRPPRPHLPGRAQGKLVARPADPHHPAQHPGAAGRAQSR